MARKEYTNIDTFQSRKTAKGEATIDNVAIAKAVNVGGLTDKISYSNNFSEIGEMLPSNGTITVSDNILTFTAGDNAGVGSFTQVRFLLNKLNYFENQKIYIEFEAKTSVTDLFLRTGNFQESFDNRLTSNFAKYSGFITPATTKTDLFRMATNGSYTPMAEGDTFQIKNLIVRPIDELGDSTLTVDEIQYKYGSGYKPTGLYFNTPDKINSTGKNLFDGDLELGTINSDGIYADADNAFRTANYIPIMQQDYILSNDNGLRNCRLAFYDNTYTFISASNPSTSKWTDGSLALNNTIIPTNAAYMRFRFYIGETIDQSYLDSIEIQLELGTEASGYEPYSLSTFEIPQPTIAEELAYSVPSGLRNYVEIVGEKKYFHKVLNKVDLGTLTYTYNPTRLYFYASIPNIKTYEDDDLTNLDFICSEYNYVGITYTTSTYFCNKSIIKEKNNLIISIKDSDYTDADLFKAAMGGTYLIYPSEEEVVTEITEDSSEVFYPDLDGIEYFEDSEGNLVSGYLEASYCDTMPMVRIGNYYLPEMSLDGYKIENNDLVSAGRNTAGEMIGTIVRADILKLVLTWNVISVDDWSKMVQKFTETDEYGGSFTNNVTSWNDVAGGFVTKQMYVSKRPCGVYMVDKSTGVPKFYKNATLTLVEV